MRLPQTAPSGLRATLVCLDIYHADGPMIHCCVDDLIVRPCFGANKYTDKALHLKALDDCGLDVNCQYSTCPKFALQVHANQCNEPLQF